MEKDDPGKTCYIIYKYALLIILNYIKIISIILIMDIILKYNAYPI